MPKDPKIKRIPSAERKIRLTKEELTYQDILAACYAIEMKMGMSSLVEVLGKCGASCADDLPKHEWSRFLRLVKDYLASV